MINIHDIISQAFPESQVDIEAKSDGVSTATLYFPFKSDMMLEYSFDFNGQQSDFIEGFKEYALRMFNVRDCADSIERQHPGKYSREELLDEVADIYSKIELSALALDKALKIDREAKNQTHSLSEQITEAENATTYQSNTSKNITHKIDR